MFELNEKTIEKIVFAMEDQEKASVVDVESGEVYQAEEKSGEQFVTPPHWSSREGFRLMEEFLSSVRVPSARRELAAALGRGRGVFKAFKAALVEFPELERAFRDYKTRAMRRPIALWYDDIRESLGLQRLGPEPEDVGELVSTDLDIKAVSWEDAREVALALLDEAEEECLEHLPAPIVVFEYDRIKAEILDSDDGLCAIIGDGEGGALGIGLAFRELAGERGFGRVFFLWIKRDFRRMGFGSALIGVLTERFANEGLSLVVVDSPFLPAEMADRMETRGFKAFGARWLSQKE
ncbi:MAG: UPF0158 family protein [Spirochaetaceae bacterium]|nr:UPF0158 family protein [Spirochaetaceae bacterium]